MTADENLLWQNFAKALGAEPRPAKTIHGASGLEHPVLLVAADDRHRRILIVSADPDSRTSALMQADIQASMPEVHVLVARPIIFDVEFVVESFIKLIGKPVIKYRELAQLFEGKGKRAERRRSDMFDKVLGDYPKKMKQADEIVSIPAVNQIIAVIRQLAAFDWMGTLEKVSKRKNANPTIALNVFRGSDLMVEDRTLGLCAVPLYEWSETDWELFKSGADLDAIREKLGELGILQFFFPPADQVALGLADRGQHSQQQIVDAIRNLPADGHPLAAHELIDPDASLDEIIEALIAMGFLVEGELEIIQPTANGGQMRNTVKYRPREGTVSKTLKALPRITLSGSLGSGS